MAEAARAENRRETGPMGKVPKTGGENKVGFFWVPCWLSAQGAKTL